MTQGSRLSSEAWRRNRIWRLRRLWFSFSQMLEVIFSFSLEGLNGTFSFSSCPPALQKLPPSVFQASLMLQASLFWLQLLWDRLNNVITRRSAVAPCVAKTRRCSGHANHYHSKTPANQVVEKQKTKRKTPLVRMFFHSLSEKDSDHCGGADINNGRV